MHYEYAINIINVPVLHVSL